MKNFLKNALLPFVLVLAVGLGTLYTADPLGDAHAEELQVGSAGDAGPVVLGLVDAGVAVANDGHGPSGPPPVVVASSDAPPPSDNPTDAYTGFKQWLAQYGWAYAILFALCCATMVASKHVDRLRHGRAAIVLGGVMAVLVTVLTAKAAGSTDAMAVAGGLNVALGAVLLFIWPAKVGIDLKTATPEEIVEALRRAGVPMASPGSR